AVDVGAATEPTPPGAAAVTPPGAGRAGQAGQAGAEEPPAGGGRGGPSFDWCNNAGPTHGYIAPGPGGTLRPPPPGFAPPPLDVKRGGIFRSENKGQSWTLMSNCNARPMYFSQIRVDPT